MKDARLVFATMKTRRAKDLISLDLGMNRGGTRGKPMSDDVSPSLPVCPSCRWRRTMSLADRRAVAMTKKMREKSRVDP